MTKQHKKLKTEHGELDLSEALQEDIEAMTDVIEEMGKLHEINDRELAALALKFRRDYTDEFTDYEQMHSIAVEFFRSREEFMNGGKPKQEQLETKIEMAVVEKEKDEVMKDRNRERVREKNKERY